MEVRPKMINSSSTVALQEDMKVNRSAEETPHMDLVESTKSEMDEIREENVKLKSALTRIMKDRHSLRTQFFDMNYEPEESKMLDDVNDVEKSRISISRGLMKRQNHSISKEEDDEEQIKYHNCKDQDDQHRLGFLQSKFEESAIRRDDHSSNASTQDSDVEKKDEVVKPWPPINKGARTTLRKEETHEEASQQPYAKRARVSVRVRCDAQTMNDGCQWRKYGQKTSKGNPCPRSYYRCTVAPSCPVRKQVQRCFEDLSILIISYEGIHNHPLSVAATAMASATAAAASMLTSGASSSISLGSASISSTSPVTIGAGLHGTSYSTLSNMISTARQFNYSLNRYNMYSSTSHPTITLDLTGTPSPSKSSTDQFKLPPGFILNSKNSTSCNFNLAYNPSESSVSPLTYTWSRTGYSTYGPLPYSNISSSSMATSLSLGPRQSQEANFNLAGSSSNTTTPPPHTQQLLTDTIARMITANPIFQSAVSAAITSYVGGGSRAAPQATGSVGRSGHGLQWREQSSASAAEMEKVINGGTLTSDFLARLNSSNSSSRY